MEKSLPKTQTYADKARMAPGSSGSSKTTRTRPKTPNPNITQFKQEMATCKTQQSLIDKLFKWKAKERDGCSLHPGSKHKLFNCFETCRICNENGWMDALVEAKMWNDQKVVCANKGEDAPKKLQEKIAT